jgi:hypothetical protein
VVETASSGAFSTGELSYWIERIQNGKMRSFEDCSWKEVRNYESARQDMKKLATLKCINAGKMEHIVNLEIKLRME